MLLTDGQTVFVIFSDMDGTLLDRETYSFEAARPALERLRIEGWPLVLCTSKTRAEVEFWRRRLNNTDPFIVENGGAAFIPKSYFGFDLPDTQERAGYDMLRFGDEYPELRAALREASRLSGTPARGFGDWSVEQVAEAAGLGLEEAELARRREFDEPFVAPENPEALLNAIQALGKRCTEGGRFFHVTGANDKAGAVKRLSEWYRRSRGAVTTVGLGDAPNDVGFLRQVDIAIRMRSPHDEQMRRALPGARVTRQTGSAGWNDALLELMAEPLRKG